MCERAPLDFGHEIMKPTYWYPHSDVCASNTSLSKIIEIKKKKNKTEIDKNLSVIIPITNHEQTSMLHLLTRKFEKNKGR